MKFKGKIAPWWYAIIILLNALLIGLIVRYHLHYISFFYIVPILALDVYLIPVCFKNDVTIDKKKVMVNFGVSKEEIPIEDILSVQRVSKLCVSFCASTDEILLSYKRDQKIVISLQDNKGFINELLKMNKKIKHYI